MIIGIEASLAFNPKKAGPDNYYYKLISNLLKIDSKNNYRLYIKGSNVPDDPNFKTPNCQIIPINWSRFWTQGGLSLECLINPPDILFIPAHTMPILRWPNLKVVVTIHDLGAQFLPKYHKFPHKYYLNFATEYAAAHASHLIAVSKSTKNDLVKKLKVDPKRITVIYEGLNHLSKVKVDLEKEFKLKKGGYFLFVGTIQPRKNLERVIQAFFQLISTHPESPVLVLVGNKGWLSDEIYELPKKLGIEERVKFLGRLDDKYLPSLYQNAIAFIYPSLYEGFGLPILEAFDNDCPVITSNTSSMPEVAGEGAILVDPNSVEEIKNAMQIITINNNFKQKLLKKAKEQVKLFSWQKAAKETLKLMEEVYEG